MIRAARSIYPPRGAIARHRHREGYIALVLRGGYEEAGDRGRVRLAAGKVAIHGAWTAHRDLFDVSGAEVLDLPLPHGATEGFGEVTDVDAIARLAERDPMAAAARLLEDLAIGASACNDWPDRLAAALVADPQMSIAGWADEQRLNPASVSRGFARAYGVSPRTFRLEARTRAALLALDGWPGTMATLAAECGFADEAHLARSVARLTGAPPARLRRVQRANSVQ